MFFCEVEIFAMNLAPLYHIVEYILLLAAMVYPIWRGFRGDSGWRVFFLGWLCFVIWWDLGEVCGEMLFGQRHSTPETTVIAGVAIVETIRAIFIGWIFGIVVLFLNLVFIAFTKRTKGEGTGEQS
jgi:hypothetical protein